jgi:hypothetical protein
VILDNENAQRAELVCREVRGFGEGDWLEQNFASARSRRT